MITSRSRIARSKVYAFKILINIINLFPIQVAQIYSPMIHLWHCFFPLTLFNTMSWKILIFFHKWKFISQGSFIFLSLWVRLSILICNRTIYILFTIMYLYSLPIFIDLVCYDLWEIIANLRNELFGMICRYFFPVHHLSLTLFLVFFYIVKNSNLFFLFNLWVLVQTLKDLSP